MPSQLIEQLREKEASVAFYEDRYTHDYMDEWPAEKNRRLFEIVQRMELPLHGKAIDFGCGKGVLTNTLQQALPKGWEVYGSDISRNAVDTANQRYPQCNFFVAGDDDFQNQKFDLLFSHHVLEHVYDLPEILNQMEDSLAENATMLHILPCGNEGSFEHEVCAMRRDGINHDIEGRFFYEDDGHVRRLTTQQLTNSFAAKGFALTAEFYSNQYYGAIDWITQMRPSFIRRFADPSAAVNDSAKAKLTQLRRNLLALWALRCPAVLTKRKLRQRDKKPRDYLAFACSLPFYVLARTDGCNFEASSRERMEG